MAYGLNKKISLKDALALTFLGALDVIAFGYEFCRRSSCPHLMTVPFEQVKDYLEKLNKKPLRKNSLYYRLKKEKVIELEKDKIKIDVNSSWWHEFFNYRFRYFSAPSKWNKKWTVVLYDIPEKHAHIRKQVRIILRKLGFKLWQRSVWITINPVTDLLKELVAEWDLLEFITVFTAQNLFSKNDLEMINKLFTPEKLQNRYDDFIQKAGKIIDRRNKVQAESLIIRFPHLINADSGLPDEFLPNPKIRQEVFYKYKQLLNLIS